jgi:hypothetical protein
LDFILKKLNFTPDEWEEIMRTPPKTFRDYPNNKFLFDIQQGYRKLGHRVKNILLRRG